MTDRHLTLIGLGAIAAIALVRAAALFTPGAPSGIDGGNWLAFGTFARPGMVYPPLVPSVFAVLVGLVGPVLATVVAGVAATAVPAIAVLAILSWARRPVAGALSALAIVSSRSIGEIAAWGGYPQPIAIAGALVALVAATAWILAGSRSALAVFAVSMAGVVATSHLVAVPTAGAIAVILIGAGIASARASGRRIATAAGIAVLPFLVLAPTYVALFATLGSPGAGRAGDAERVLGFVWPVYLAILIAVPLGLALLMWRRSRADSIGSRDLALMVAGSAAAVSWILAYLVSGEPRLLHDIGVLTIFGVAALVPVIRSAIGAMGVRRLLSSLTFAAVVILTATGLAAFPDQVAYYHVLSSDQFAAIEWLAGQSSTKPRTILAADERGVPVGWWVEGRVGQEVLFASDFRWLRFESERERAKSANALLYLSSFPDAASVTTVRKAGVRFVFLPSSAAFGVDPGDAPSGWHVEFASGDAVVLSPAAMVGIGPVP